MISSHNKTITGALSLFVLFFTHIAYASSPIQASPLPRCPAGMYDPLAPIGTFVGKTCYTLTEYLNGIFTTVIGIAGILAVVMIVVCGIRMMTTGSVAGRSEAKECIFNAIFGVLIAIGSWLLLNTINPQLLRNDAQVTVTTGLETGKSEYKVTDAPMPTQPNFQPGFYYRYRESGGPIKNSSMYPSIEACNAAQKGQADSGGEITAGPSGTIGCFYLQKTPTPVAAAASASAGEDATRNWICGNTSCVPTAKTPNNTGKLFVNKPACDPYNANYKLCRAGTGTNVGGLPRGTIDGLIALASACSCTVTITGGTEAGHVSHGANIPVFDLGRTPELVARIKANANLKANPSFCSPTRPPNGVCFSKWRYTMSDGEYWFTDETDAEKYGIKPHWHVCKEGTPPDANTPQKNSVFASACNKL